MTIQECYAQAGGDYREVIERIGNESRLEKYLRKFLTDKSYQEMLAALAQENWHEAFLCVHNLKGLCANLSMNNAAQAANVLCEALRHGQPDKDIAKLCDEFRSAYQQTLTAVNSFFEECVKKSL